MDFKTTASAKGQIVIPKFLRDTIGIHQGTELIIHMREDQTLEFRTIKKKLSEFFGKGCQATKNYKLEETSFDVDGAIVEAITLNNPNLGNNHK